MEYFHEITSEINKAEKRRNFYYTTILDILKNEYKLNLTTSILEKEGATPGCVINGAGVGDVPLKIYVKDTSGDRIDPRELFLYKLFWCGLEIQGWTFDGIKIVFI